mmetsp:Transcript_30942/g.65602  ORF Transcript_30942/g.65602 Transcript_30942/m.65602 type:complete len:543 (+) Transcript_30942:124-1752(+)|eukprot:CAMPEP_0206421060 /NCGR_PEP_ID=MMETSP0324_2-20121206/1233_1 /ASSEMBLY_ACC=CAM_ASM_000836 /TAXON_ID=2866 /ORGANISM="Crypthecodinium cohnii, Strain Seligo" /LENGTH=542 /DNA_ID=CAMNT_0053885103 /DNA_START=48 /DNA_END=1676 /DNA_ORIENTATION=+
MGQSATRGYMCCAVRDKEGTETVKVEGKAPQFCMIGTEIPLLDEACFLQFAPLYQPESSRPRRLAVGNTKELEVYYMRQAEQHIEAADSEDPHSTTLAHVVKSHSLRPEVGMRITSVLFCDDGDSSRLIVAVGPSESGLPGGSALSMLRANSGSRNQVSVKVFPCIEKGSDHYWESGVVAWHWEKSASASLEYHSASIVKMSNNRQNVVLGDLDGQVSVWIKAKDGQPWTRKVANHCHQTGIADLCVDREFAFTCGRKESVVCVWLVSSLLQILKLPMHIPEQVVTNLKPPPQPYAPAVSLSLAGPVLEAVSPTRSNSSSTSFDDPSPIFARINLIKRPQTRWSGVASAHKKGLIQKKTAYGTLFVAAILGPAGATGSVGPGAGILMEWSLGEHPRLRSIHTAHESPIVAMSFGPYDNGPLVTADLRGSFRVWEMALSGGLQLSQQIMTDVGPVQAPSLQVLALDDWAKCLLPASSSWPAMATEPPRAVYIVVSGALSVWQRQFSGVPGSGPVATLAAPLLLRQSRNSEQEVRASSLSSTTV